MKTLITLVVVALCLTVSGYVSANIDIPTERYTIADIVEQVSRAVVSVNVGMEAELDRGNGSGFIVERDGLILTNYHVIEGVDNITVQLIDGTSFTNVEVVGFDEKSDIALLQVPNDQLYYDLPVISLGDSDEAKVGEWVVAFGNPFLFHLGSQLTVTAGIISTKDRVVEMKQGAYQEFIQTDAAINPGNSGGPLVNLEGEVLGINTAIIPYAQGIGFAIPINTAKRVTKDLLAFGKVIRPWLGIGVSRVTHEIAVDANLQEPKGALIAYVIPGSPADEIGLREKDIIIELDREIISNPQQITRMVEGFEIGEKVTLVILRNGQRRHLVIEVSEAP